MEKLSKKTEPIDIIDSAKSIQACLLLIERRVDSNETHRLCLRAIARLEVLQGQFRDLYLQNTNGRGKL